MLLLERTEAMETDDDALYKLIRLFSFGKLLRHCRTSSSSKKNKQKTTKKKRITTRNATWPKQLVACWRFAVDSCQCIYNVVITNNTRDFLYFFLRHWSMAKFWMEPLKQTKLFALRNREHAQHTANAHELDIHCNDLNNGRGWREHQISEPTKNNKPKKITSGWQTHNMYKKTKKKVIK